MATSGQNRGPAPSRASLAIQASVWRGLQSCGTSLDWLMSHEQRQHSFVTSVEISAPFTPGQLPLYFYLPKSYQRGKPGQSYPIIVNFHGGGFTIGDARDDIRWANQVCDELDAVVVGVGYRKAPQFPYPVAVQDGVVALDYLAANAKDLGLDTSRTVLSGFSAGGNLTFAVPLLYHSLQQKTNDGNEGASNPLAIPRDWSSEHLKVNSGSPCQIVALAGFYPSLNYALTREERCATNPKPSENLPPILTNMFDYSYLPMRPEEAKEMNKNLAEDCPLREPFLSPALASDELLKEALPNIIFILTCENDMLQREGQDFSEKLSTLGKDVKYFKASNCRHGWDKVPKVLSWGERATWSEQQIKVSYAEACEFLKQTLNKSQ